MYRFKASDQYTRFFKHAIRNGKNELDAADEAMTKSRQVMLDLLRADPTLSEQQKNETWADIVDILIVARGMILEITKELPIDKEKLSKQAEERNATEIANATARATNNN